MTSRTPQLLIVYIVVIHSSMTSRTPQLLVYIIVIHSVNELQLQNAHN